MNINLDDLKRAIDKGLSTTGDAINAGAQWAKDNPVVAAAMLVGVRQLAKAGRRNKDAAEKRRQRLIWDPAARHYWETKRELKQSEWLEVERLKRQGMTIGEALSEMNLLKR